MEEKGFQDMQASSKRCADSAKDHKTAFYRVYEVEGMSSKDIAELGDYVMMPVAGSDKASFAFDWIGYPCVVSNMC